MYLFKLVHGPSTWPGYPYDKSVTVNPIIILGIFVLVGVHYYRRSVTAKESSA